MTLDEFINKNKGKKLDFDHAFKNQCMDLYRYYVKDVWGLPQTPGVKGAFQVFNTLPKGYDKFTRGEIRPGDVMVWSEKQVKNGHIAVVTASDAKGFSCFQQNAPKEFDPCNIARYPYKNLIGWFRPHVEPAPIPTPMPTPTFPVKIKATVVLNFPSPWLTIDQKNQIIKDWYAQNSDNKINIEFTVKYSNFSTVPFFMYPDGSAVVNEVWFDTNVLDPSADTTILIIDPALMPGYFPGAYVLVGRTLGYMGQKPTKTVVTALEAQMSGTYPQINAYVDYVRHELMHSCYLFGGGADGSGFDMTHKYFFLPSYNPPGLGNPEGAFTDPLLNYDNIFQTLNKKGNVMLVYKFDDNPTVYVLSDDATLIGATGPGLTKTLKGRPQKLITLPASQRVNFVIADSAIN